MLYIMQQAWGHVNAIDALIEHGAHKNTRDNIGCTALFEAAHNGHVQALITLIKKHGFDPNSRDIQGATPLHAAAFRGHVEAMKILIDKGAHKAILANNGANALYFAASGGKVAAITSLIKDHGFNPNCASSDKSTPLHIAACNGHVESIKTLIEHGASKEALDKKGANALHWAAKGGKAPAIVSLIKDHGFDPNKGRVDKITPLHYAACLGHVDAIAALIAHGATKDGRSNSGASALYFAARNGQKDAIIALIKDHKLDPNSVTLSLETPLHSAAFNGRAGAIDALISHGARKETLLNGNNALQLAAVNGKITTVKHLMKTHGYSINAPYANSTQTALDTVIGKQDVETARQLLALGAILQLSTLSTNRGLSLVQNNPQMTALLKEHLSKNNEFIERIHNACPICQDHFYQGDFSIDKIDFEKICVTNCCKKTYFHKTCLAQTLAHNPLCPICRAPNPR